MDPDRPVAVTGAAGFLGGRVVRSMDGAALALARTVVPWLPADQQASVDLLASETRLEAALERSRAVVHLAGHNEVVTATDPDQARAETVAMAERVAEAAAATGVARVVYVSTVHVYGASLQPGAVVDEQSPAAPISPYARARAAVEDVLRADDRIDLVVLRLTNAVGAAADVSVDRWTLVANDLSRQAVLDRRLVLHSPGLQWRDFIALTDACRAITAAADPALVPSGTYNLGAGRSTQVRQLAELVQDRVEVRCGFRPGLVAPPADGPAEPPYRVDVRALAALGLQADPDLTSSVDEIVDQCAANEAALRAALPAPG
jgi:UDP-glucose 4-epimerase